MTKTECIEIFNAIINGTPVDFQNNLLPLFSEYLTENNIENPGKMINLVINEPHLLQSFIPKIINYYRNKYTILSIVFNNKTILYYE